METIDRPTKEKTIGNHKIVYKEYLTKRDRLSIDKAGTANASSIMQQGSQEMEMKGFFDPEAATNAGIKAVLIKVDDFEGDAMCNFLLDMKEQESDPIFDFINEQTEEHKKEAKKN